MWVSLPSDDTFVSNFSNAWCSGRGKGKFYCTRCKKYGHTQDQCFNLHDFPNKIANIAQTSTILESKGELETTFSVDEYKEYLKFKATQYSTSSTIIPHTGNSTICLCHFTPIGRVMDYGALDHVTNNAQFSLIYYH